jgi:hypothetical protein
LRICAEAIRENGRESVMLDFVAMIANQIGKDFSPSRSDADIRDRLPERTVDNNGLTNIDVPYRSKRSSG